MIEKETLLSMPFLEKSRFTGSYHGMRYTIYKKKEETETAEGEKQEALFLEGAAAPGPYSVDQTREDLFVRARFPFSDEGRRLVIDWLNEEYENRRSLYEDVEKHPMHYYEQHHKIPNR